MLEEPLEHIGFGKYTIHRCRPTCAVSSSLCNRMAGGGALSFPTKPGLTKSSCPLREHRLSTFFAWHDELGAFCSWANAKGMRISEREHLGLSQNMGPRKCAVSLGIALNTIQRHTLIKHKPSIGDLTRGCNQAYQTCCRNDMYSIRVRLLVRTHG